MNINRLFLRFDADTGKRFGLGHFNRSLKIFKILKQTKKFKIYFLLEKDNLANKILKKKFKNIIFFKLKNLKKLNFNKKDLIIIDTLGSTKSFFNFLNKTQIKKISFDELHLKNFQSGIIINGIYFAKKKLVSKNKSIKIFQGPQYIGLDESFSKSIPDKKKRESRIALVTSGGADKTNLLYKISNYLLDLEHYKKIFIIVGPGVTKHNRIYNLKSNKINLITGATNLKRYIDLSQDIFTSGGTVMFETIARNKVPNVIMSYKHQKYAINFFNRNKLINFLGTQKSLKFNSLKLNLQEKDKRRFASGRKLIDGLGIKRIVSIIKKITN